MPAIVLGMAVRMNSLAASRGEDNPVYGTLLALLLRHVECAPPLLVAAQWEKFVRSDRDLWKVDLLGAGAVRVRCDKLTAELRARFNEHSGLRVANLVVFERGELQVLLLRPLVVRLLHGAGAAGAGS